MTLSGYCIRNKEEEAAAIAADEECRWGQGREVHAEDAAVNAASVTTRQP